ncbi:MAG: response regulator [Caldimonas sp.]
MEIEAGPAGLKLLLVEDNFDAAEALVCALESYGHSVVHAATQREALERGAAGGFDVIVTDLGLPDGSGIEIGRQLGRSIPVIALSGYGTTKDRAESARAGFVGHLVKPAELDSIHAMVHKVAGKPAGPPSQG